MIFMKMHFILNSSEVVCDKNPLSKIQSVEHERLAINHSEGQCNRVGLLCWPCFSAMASQISKLCDLANDLQGQRSEWHPALSQ